MSDVHVIGVPQSNYVWAVRIALAEKGVAHTNIPAVPHGPEVLAFHPLGKIPVLRHGDVAIAESRAIIDYVDRVFDGPRLIPADPSLAMREDIWTSIVTTSMDPLLVRQYLFAYLFPGTADGAPDRARIEATLPKVAAALSVLDQAVDEGQIGKGPFGRTDAYLVPILFYLRNSPEGGQMLAARPGLAAYLDARLQRPSIRSTMPPPLQSAA